MNNLRYGWLLIIIGFGAAIAGNHTLSSSGSLLFLFSSFGGGILIGEGWRYVKS